MPGWPTTSRTFAYGGEEAAEELAGVHRVLGCAADGPALSDVQLTASSLNGTSSMQDHGGAWTLRGSFAPSASPSRTCARSPIDLRDAEERGKTGHGFSRVTWLETLPDLDLSARPERLVAEEGYERWDGGGAIGYLTLAAICDAGLNDRRRGNGARRSGGARETFPTGMLGYWVRLLAEGGLAAALTTTSPPRLAPPDGGPWLAGTNPLAIGIPSSDGAPVVADVSMAVGHPRGV